MATLQSRNIPRSGSTALAAGALVQAILGGEFVLAGLNKLADPQYVAHFRDFVSGSAGLIGGPLASLVRLVVLPNVTLMAQLARFTELGAGLVLVLVAFEVAWRRFHGRLGTRHGYEPAVALGVANNERLTALAGMPLFILLAAMAVTVLFVQQLLPEHYLVGFLLIPPLALKLASTGYRFARYYTRNRSYRLAGPPPVLLRLVAVVLVISTGAVFVTGIELWLVGLRFGNTWIEAHTLSSFVMILATGVHTLGHLRRSAAAAVEEVTAPPSREAFTRRSLVVASMVLGAVLAAASLLCSTPFPPAAAGG